MTRRRPRRFLPSVGIGRDLIEASPPRIADSIGADILHRKRLTAAAVQARGMRVIGPCRRPGARFHRCAGAAGPEAGAASARSFKPRAETTLRTVSNVGLRSPESAL